MGIDLTRIAVHRNTAPTRSPQLARGRAHEAFDQIWKKGYMSRSDAYEWLAKEMGVDEFHMKTASVEECERVVGLSKKLLDDLHPVPDEEADPWGLGYPIKQNE